MLNTLYFYYVDVKPEIYKAYRNKDALAFAQQLPYISLFTHL